MYGVSVFGTPVGVKRADNLFKDELIVFLGRPLID
jgi:hypothetical protein